jgi:hypothetical protein
MERGSQGMPQEAPWLELTALAGLFEHSSATTKDRLALATVVDAVPQARGVRDRPDSDRLATVC